MTIQQAKTDRTGYNQLYKGKISEFAKARNVDDYIANFEQRQITPFYAGGPTKGYVRKLAINRLFEAVRDLRLRPNEVTILDAGCGMGELSAYLACNNFNVVGVDISEEACGAAEKLSINLGVSDRCKFIPSSLERISIADNSVDFIIGFASLHHFIKYDTIPSEFLRIMKDHSQGFFADSFGENKLYHVFHNKKKMAELGDVTLTRSLINAYFNQFDVDLVPTDWFVMFDKLIPKLIPKKYHSWYRKLARINFWLDRRIPFRNRAALFFSGSVFTNIKVKVQT